MITDYLEAAMNAARYEQMENGRFWADVPPCPGVWAEGETRESCREELAEVIESWLVIKLRHNDEIPIVGGVNFNAAPEYADAN